MSAPPRHTHELIDGELKLAAIGAAVSLGRQLRELVDRQHRPSGGRMGPSSDLTGAPLARARRALTPK